MNLYIESSFPMHVGATGDRQPRTGNSPRRCKPLDPTTAAAMRLAQLRAEERAAVSRGDAAALQEIRQSIERELAWEKA